MTRRELEELAPWIAAGVGMAIAASDEYLPYPASVRKGYVADLGNDVYALTERGAEHAERIQARAAEL